MKNIFILSRLTFHKAIKAKILYNLFFLSILLILFAAVVGSQSFGERFRIIIDMGLMAVLFFGIFTAIFLGTSQIQRERELKTILIWLSGPVSKREFLLSIFFGLSVTLLLLIFVSGFFLLLFLYIFGSGFQYSYLIAWLMVFYQSIIILSVAIFFSTISPPMTATFFSFAIYIAGNFLADLKHYGERSGQLVIKWLTTISYYLLPNLKNFDFGQVLSGEYINLFPLHLYLFVYLLFVLVAACIIFNKKEFQ